ncbi:protein kinase domain-containing protein [Yinghuangia seranimata]|uniref:protein kinase domain-containing protein n=1 Tax=Yinghuangia seranimata TaxID=408067 RepID=UPI00248B410B|nr:protein kinase [Yinghuangia seranimata]MDI2131419.1 protein kinase [Yinghuangia seranimata]
MARRIGSRYVALKVLGRGASGTVWAGEGPEGPVAIKLLREDLASDEVLVARFVQERTALVSLDHPGIVGIHDLVVDGSDLALVMDLVDGPDLRTRLEKERSLTPALAAAICADVAEGLSAAHAEGVIHRDVKPENVLLDTRGGQVRAKLTDFGIARLVDAPRRTRATRIIGTPDYLAPEIIEGLQPTAAVDVYALGTVLYELLTGWTPFGGGHPGAVLRRHVTEPVPGIPGLPAPVAEVLAACLSKAPAARLTAREVGERLRAALPALAGLPRFDIPAPDGAGHPDRGETPPPLPAGVVPLVSGAEPDASRDTHTNLARPTFSAPPIAASRRRTTHRRRRGRTLVTVCAVVAVAAVGAVGWWYAGRDDGDAGTPAPVSNTVSPPAQGAAPAPVPPSASAGIGDTQAARVPTWDRWLGLPIAPVQLLGGPAAAQAAGDRAYVVQRDAAGQPWATSGDGAKYADWQRLPVFKTGEDVAVAAPAPGRLEVLAVGSVDKLLYRCTLADGKWGDWVRMDAKTKVTGAPAATVTGDRLDVVVRSGDALAYGSLAGVVPGGGSWSGFATVPSAGRIEQAPALVASGAGTVDAFVVRAGDHALLHVALAGGAWREPQRVGPSGSARPAAAWTQGGGLVVVVPDPGGKLLGAVTGAGPDAWRPLDLARPAPDGAAAVAAAPDRVDVYVRTQSGQVQVAPSA